MAASQPPATGDQPPEQTTQPAASDQRGTDQVPLTVKVMPAPDAKEQADKAEHAAKEKAVIDEKLAFETQRIADYTDRLTWFTIGLVFVAIIQASLFIWQLLELQDAGKATRKAADAALMQATSIILAERPYLSLRIAHVGVVGHRDSPFHWIRGEHRFGYEFANYGKTPAFIQEVNARPLIVDGVGAVPDPLDPMKHRGKLVPVGTVSAPDHPWGERFDLSKAVGGYVVGDEHATAHKRLCFHGFVRFSDAFEKRYIVGFLTVFRPIANGWEMRGGKEYNYAREERLDDIPPHPDYPGESV
jgi:hypothetical protein